MNIVTIMNYPNDRNANTLCLMWMYFIQKNCRKHDSIHILSSQPLNIYLKSRFKQYNNISYDVRSEWKPKTFLHNLQNEHNIKFKLYNLCHLDFPYIFLDCDCMVLDDPHYLWEKRNDKPLIAINHQTAINNRDWNFINTGVLIVGQSRIFDFKQIIQAMIDNEFKLEIGGCDQPFIWNYFKRIEYDYTHPEVTSQWNSCSDYNTVFRDDNGNWTGFTHGLENNHKVSIHHYWNTKPWHTNCPIFENFQRFITK